MFAGLKARGVGLAAAAAVHGAAAIALIFAANAAKPAGDSARGSVVVMQIFDVPLESRQPAASEPAGAYVDNRAPPEPKRPDVPPLARIATASESPIIELSTAAASGSTETTQPALSASIADLTAESAYRAELLAHIAKFRAYPEDGRGALGLARVFLEVDRDGRVLDIWIDRSSGNAILDTAAMETVRRAAPLPPIPAELPNSLTVLLPFAFDAQSASRTYGAPARSPFGDAGAPS